MLMLVVGGWGEPRRRIVERRRRERTRAADRVREPRWLLRVGVVVSLRGKRGNMSVSLFLGISAVFIFLCPAGSVPFADADEGRSSILACRGTVFVSDDKTIPKDEKTGEPLEVRLRLSLSFKARFCLLAWRADPSFPFSLRLSHPVPAHQQCIMCFDEFEAEQRLARLSCYCLYHEECIVSYWENPSSASTPALSPPHGFF